MAQAAGRVGVTPGTLTEGVKRLTKSGFVTRQRATGDDRVVELSLSAKGTRLFADIRQSREEFFRALCRDLDEGACRDLIESHRLIARTYARIVQQKQGGVP
jgi:DNA-binding MarR family transcriptional regulator